MRRSRSASARPRSIQAGSGESIRRRTRSAAPGGMVYNPQLMQGDYLDPVTGRAQGYFVEEHGSVQSKNPRFLLDEYATTLRIKNLDECSSPEALLHKILRRSIQMLAETAMWLSLESA